MQRTRAIISVLALGCATACASGPPGPPGGGPPDGARPGGMLQEAKIARPIAILFTGMDANRDLVLSREEFEAAIPTEFARADVDHSGVVTGFEMTDWCRLMMGDKEAQPDMRAADTDMNYTITPAEFSVALRHEFDRMDKDQNGIITRAEMLMDAPQRMMGLEGGPRGPPGGQSGGRGRPPVGAGAGRRWSRWRTGLSSPTYRHKIAPFNSRRRVQRWGASQAPSVDDANAPRAGSPTCRIVPNTEPLPTSPFRCPGLTAAPPKRQDRI